jgi:hypothetical protein
MRLMALVAGTLLLFCISQNVNAAFKTGNALYDDCTSDSPPKRTLCLGYVTGFSDAREELGLMCPAKGVDVRQMIDVVVKYLSDHPEVRQHYTASDKVGLALEKAFPCKEQAH